jgi:hypothetical protein
MAGGAAVSGFRYWIDRLVNAERWQYQYRGGNWCEEMLDYVSALRMARHSDLCTGRIRYVWRPKEPKPNKITEER